jgi:hypothetical protein
MKKLLTLFALLLLPNICSASETALTVYSEPTNVTLTASTTIGCAYIVGTGNSLVAWTLVDGSKQATTSAKRWYLTAPGATYDLRYTYNSSTWTVDAIKSWGLLSKSAQIVRRLNIPNGVFVSLTFTTIYDGGAMPTVDAYFESEK